MKRDYKIVAVDFDGTLCENKWPEIGEANEELIWYLRKRQADGDKIILWTCRTGKQLYEAIFKCYECGLIFNAVNENLPETVEWAKGDSRKIFADEYIDDKNVLVSSCHEKSKMELWAENEIAIACKREAPNRKEGEWDYGCACYESAFKAYKSLLEDHHSGMSMGFTQQILNRFILAKPCVPIEDTDDAWTEAYSFEDSKSYQCKRMYSLFKTVYPDGTIEYCDVERALGYNINDDCGPYHSGLIDRVVSKMYPITMPYLPEDKPYMMYTEQLLTDRKNGDFDTMALLYVVCPDGTRTEINRFFKDNPDKGWDEIDEAEYLERKLMHEERIKKEIDCK